MQKLITTNIESFFLLIKPLFATALNAFFGLGFNFPKMLERVSHEYDKRFHQNVQQKFLLIFCRSKFTQKL